MVTTVTAVHGTTNVESAENLKREKKTVTPPVFNYDVSVSYEQLIKSPVLSEEVKGLLISSTAKMGIKNYTLSLLKDDHTAIAKSQNHLIDMLKYYEGDRNYYYEAITSPYKDCYGTYTCGFGELTNKYRTQEQSYEKMLKHLESNAKEIRNLFNKNFGKGSYDDEQFPISIKEGLIDLAYNKGVGKISSNTELMDAIRNKDYSVVVRNLAYVYSGKKNADKVENPGLYRRSLSRLILACRDLTGRERTEAIIEVDNLYAKAKKCFQLNNANTSELDNIYYQFKNGKILTTPKSAVSYKIKIDERFKGKGVESVIRSLYNTYSNSEVSFEDFRKEFLRINGQPASVKLGQDFKVPVIPTGTIEAMTEETTNISSEDNAEACIEDNQQEDEAVSVEEVSENISDGTQTEKPISSNNNSEVKPSPSINPTPEKENNFWSTLGEKACQLGNAIKSFFLGSPKKTNSKNSKKTTPANQIVQKEITQSVKASEIEESRMEEIKTPMQRLLENPSVKIQKDGELEIISVDYEYDSESNLQGIAHNFGTTEAIICSDNNIKSEKELRDGNKHKIKIQKMGYRIKQGESLTQIAKKFGLSLEILKDLNNIDNIDEISTDNILEIPGFAYTVENNDTLYKISKRVGVSVEQLMKINNLSNSDIKPGQTIKVVYNDADYNIEDKKKKTVIDKVTNDKVQTVDMRNKNNKKVYHKREFIQKKTKINSKVVATRVVFESKSKSAKNGPLAGKTIIVNAGHGYSQSGVDIGSKGTNGLEDEWLVNYDNAMRLKDRLVAQGAKVIFLQGHRRLITEALQKPENKGDLFISVHANSIASPTNDRTQFYYREQGVSGAAKSRSLQFAQIAERKFDEWIPKHEKFNNQNEKFINKGTQDYAQVSLNDNRTGLLKTPLNKQNIPGIIWEVAFMSTDKGRSRLQDDNLMKNYAEVMTQSIIEARQKGIF